jgi:hypothetical protein
VNVPSAVGLNLSRAASSACISISITWIFFRLAAVLEEDEPPEVLLFAGRAFTAD